MSDKQPVSLKKRKKSLDAVDVADRKCIIHYSRNTDETTVRILTENAFSKIKGSIFVLIYQSTHIDVLFACMMQSFKTCTQLSICKTMAKITCLSKKCICTYCLMLVRVHRVSKTWFCFGQPILRNNMSGDSSHVNVNVEDTLFWLSPTIESCN